VYYYIEYILTYGIIVLIIIIILHGHNNIKNMRHVVLKDKKITKKALEAWKVEDVAFWEKNIGVTPTYEVIDTDYTTYPTYIDEDKDVRPTYEYLQTKTNEVVKKFGDFGTDFIMVMVHEDNWKSDTTPDIKGDGIWGTNYSYVFGKQCLEYCRWDKDNTANTFGTAYHERHHSFDALIKVETGVDIEPLLGVVGYDKSITHGGAKPWKYIRHKENLASLKTMKPHLQEAFRIRKERHDKVIVGLMETVVNLATQVLYILRKQHYQKDGVPR
jgi:hypothetical protein